jgi:hypothetical protein
MLFAIISFRMKCRKLKQRKSGASQRDNATKIAGNKAVNCSRDGLQGMVALAVTPYPQRQTSSMSSITRDKALCLKGSGTLL